MKTISKLVVFKLFEGGMKNKVGVFCKEHKQTLEEVFELAETMSLRCNKKTKDSLHFGDWLSIYFMPFEENQSICGFRFNTALIEGSKYSVGKVFYK